MSRPEDKTVLVVDDEEDLREYLSTVLEDAGFNVVTAADGEAAAEGEWRGGKAASAMSKEIKTLFTNEQIAAILPHRWILAVCVCCWFGGLMVGTDKGPCPVSSVPP